MTVSDADAKSSPLPGPELLKQVKEAKIRGEVPQAYHSATIRLVDDKWMVPQMCNEYVKNPRLL